MMYPSWHQIGQKSKRDTGRVFVFCGTDCHERWQMPPGVTACRSGMSEPRRRDPHCAECGRKLSTTLR